MFGYETLYFAVLLYLKERSPFNLLRINIFNSCYSK